MNAATKAAQSLIIIIIITVNDSDLIPCPVLGSEPLTDKIVKRFCAHSA